MNTKILWIKKSLLKELESWLWYKSVDPVLGSFSLVFTLVFAHVS